MAQIDSLRTHLIEELADTLDAERQLTKALPKMARAAASAKLKAAFQSHLKETERHVERIKQALQQLGERTASKTCEGMQGLLEEGETLMNEAPGGALRDAVMITSAQKVEHYEIASYGTVRTWARLCGQEEAANLLQETLDEESQTDERLTELAESIVNPRAEEGGDDEESSAGGAKKSSSKKSSGGKKSSSSKKSGGSKSRR